MNNLKKTITKEEYFLIKNEAYKRAVEFFNLENKELKEQYIRTYCPIKENAEAELIFKNTLLIPDDKTFLLESADIKVVIDNLREKYRVPKNLIIIKYLELQAYNYEEILKEVTFYEVDFCKCRESNIFNIKVEKQKKVNLDIVENLWPEYDRSLDDKRKTR